MQLEQLLQLALIRKAIRSLYGYQQLKSNLPDGESNPGLPRDRRGYLPLYYRGLLIGMKGNLDLDYD